MLDFSSVTSLLALGAIVGLLGGLFGVGGGGIMVPALTSFFISMQMEPATSVRASLGTSLACIIFTTLSSAYGHYRRDNIEWKVFPKLALGTILGALSAGTIVSQINHIALSIVFSCFMMYVAVRMFQSARKIEPTYEGSPLLLPAGFSIGFISTLVSVGGGALTTPYLNKQGVAMRRCIGTSATLGVVVSLVGSFGYAVTMTKSISNLEGHFWGYVYWPAVILIAFASIFSVPLGIRLSQRLSGAGLKKVFSIFLVLLSLSMVCSLL